MEMHELRRNYDQHSLELRDLESDPLRQFQQWLQEAHLAEVPKWLEVNAMTLATSDLTGHVTARMVLLKGVDSAGFAFFSNYQSDKAKQLDANPQASLVFYWPHLERQVRVEGIVGRTDAATSDDYFHARPRGSQIGAVVSPQSQPLASREELQQATDALAEKYPEGTEIPRPDYWGGYRLAPHRIEFWQGRPSRLHDRFAYTLAATEANGTAAWTLMRLAP